MWVYRLGVERVQAHALLSGDLIDGLQAKRWGLGQAVPESELDAEVEKLAQRMVTIPRNQLVMQKLMVNQVLENMGFASSQVLATLPKEQISRKEQKNLVGNKRYKTATKVHLTGLKIFHSPKRSLKAKETCCEKYSTGSWFSHPCNANF